ncbi:MAG: hypothetical protein ACQXXE_08735 [Candidatus Bathyarchaeia archaeon]
MEKKLNLLYWLYFYNPFFVALTFIGLICAFIFSENVVTAAFGLGFIASLCLEVWRSYLNIKYYKGDPLNTQDEYEDEEN